MKAILFSLLGALCIPALAADNWPQFRGPNRDGVSAETGLLQKWRFRGPPPLGSSRF